MNECLVVYQPGKNDEPAILAAGDRRQRCFFQSPPVALNRSGPEPRVTGRPDQLAGIQSSARAGELVPEFTDIRRQTMQAYDDGQAFKTGIMLPFTRMDLRHSLHPPSMVCAASGNRIFPTRAWSVESHVAVFNTVMAASHEIQACPTGRVATEATGDKYAMMELTAASRKQRPSCLSAAGASPFHRRLYNTLQQGR